MAVPQEPVLQISSSVRIFPPSQPSTVALLNEITQGSPAQGKENESLPQTKGCSVLPCQTGRKFQLMSGIETLGSFLKIKQHHRYVEFN